MHSTISTYDLIVICDVNPTEEGAGSWEPWSAVCILGSVSTIIPVVLYHHACIIHALFFVL